MNGKKAKLIRKLSGYDPSKDRKAKVTLLRRLLPGSHILSPTHKVLPRTFALRGSKAVYRRLKDDWNAGGSRRKSVEARLKGMA